MEELSRYQSDHLILLVGGNPLPNAVAGKLLSKPGGTITLLHSGNTAATAQKLHAWLSSHTQAAIQFKQIDEVSPASIAQGVTAQLRSVRADTVGLHYTGGTKTMSVHAYRAVEQWGQTQHLTPVYSYLDAHSLSLVVDSEPQSASLAGKVKLTLNDLLALHGWRTKTPPNIKPVLPKFAQALLQLYSDNNITVWNEWKEQQLGKCQRLDRPDKWLSKTALNNIMLNWPLAPELTAVIAALQEELAQGDDGLRVKTATQEGIKIGIFKEPEDLCKHLDGGYWLESCVLEALHSIANNHRLHSLCTSIRVPTIGDKDFELDVVAIRDYQLVGFSCSTDSEAVKGGRERLKLKLFEAYVRAQQLGGDEARVALVCSAEDPEGLQAEMRRDLTPHIRVFGRKHLLNLAAEFAHWIQPV